MKVCNDCNRSNIDNTIFCLNCGSTKLVVISDRFPWEDIEVVKIVGDEDKSKGGKCSGNSCDGGCSP